MPSLDATLYALVKRDRVVVLGGLALLGALSWLYTVVTAQAMMMPAGMGQGMIGGAMPPWTVTTGLYMLLMWTVMMAAMMTPSAAPMLLTYAKLSRLRARGASPRLAVALFLLGYLALWTGFSVVATAVQWALQAGGHLSPAMASATPALSGALLIAAGVYQLTPLKRACLDKCRAPKDYLFTAWRDGSAAAFGIGARHGLYCIGCCWVLMALLFVGGVMNLMWIAALAAIVFAEKALPFGRALSVVLAAGAIAWGLMILIG